MDIYRNNIFFYLITVLFISVVLQSCRTISSVTERREYYSGQDIYENLLLNRAEMDTYSAGRLIVRINDNGEEISFRGSVRIKRDSAILLSINAIAGIEAARLLFTPDSIKMIDRINNNYFLGNYLDAERIFPFTLDYNIIQSIFLASPERIIEEFDILSDRRRRYSFEDDLIKIRASGNVLSGSKVIDAKSDELQILIDRDFLTRGVEYHSGKDNIFASLRYNTFNKTGRYLLPDDISLNFVSHNLPFYANVKLSRLEVDKDLTFPFNIPSKYTRVQ
jgi:hypothetical protein